MTPTPRHSSQHGCPALRLRAEQVYNLSHKSLCIRARLQPCRNSFNKNLGFRDCVATLPPLRGSRNFPTCTRGLRPGLTSTPPLRDYFDRGVEFCSTSGPHFRLRHSLFSPAKLPPPQMALATAR